MICRKDAPDLPLCGCPECDESRRETMRRVFIRGVDYSQNDYQRDWSEADKDQWGNQTYIKGDA